MAAVDEAIICYIKPFLFVCKADDCEDELGSYDRNKFLNSKRTVRVKFGDQAKESRCVLISNKGKHKVVSSVSQRKTKILLSFLFLICFSVTNRYPNYLNYNLFRQAISFLTKQSKLSRAKLKAHWSSSIRSITTRKSRRFRASQCSISALFSNSSTTRRHG